MRYFIITGELSGDMHAAAMVNALKQIDSKAEFQFTGGSYLQTACNSKPLVALENMSFMGFYEVIRNIKTISNNFKQIKSAILKFKPHALILVDYPGFNLRMAKWAKQQGLDVFYYIAPSVWAWNTSRISVLKQYVNRLYVILPFEYNFFKNHLLEVEFVGHPLAERIALEQHTEQYGLLKMQGLGKKPIIAVFPGSRSQEVKRILPECLGLTAAFPDYDCVISKSPLLPWAYYENAKALGFKVIEGAAYEILKHAKAGVIKSGTSTLEAALFNVPQVVVYKTSKLSFLIAKLLVKLKFISLVNLILNKEVVKELIQQQCNTVQIINALKQCIEHTAYQHTILNEYATLRSMLQHQGVSSRLAQSVYKRIVKDAF
ncbi:MAG: lipid-A-disaccharide synthase [Bacteroidia bacterium]|jgi:lipid-A-disaccharide synthase